MGDISHLGSGYRYGLAFFGLSKFRKPEVPFTQRMIAVISSALLVLALLMESASASAAATTPPSGMGTQQATPRVSVAALASDMKVGDVVFIRVAAKPFREVAAATNSWTNHVGVVVDTSGAEPMIGESKFPRSRTTGLSKFVARSEGGRVSVSRLKTELTAQQRVRVVAAVDQRSGIFYDTGFNLHSRRQFCSRYVREVLIEATGTSVGEVETFSQLLAGKPDANLGFWKLWYLGRIPWQRETVTPASLLRSPALWPMFDGVAVATKDR